VPAQYRALLEDPRRMTFDTWDRICDQYGWPQTFAGVRSSAGPGKNLKKFRVHSKSG
jgi:hypothetical protein